MTYTLATLAISAAAHAEVRDKLVAADGRKIRDDEPLDMHGIALVVDVPETAEAAFVQAAAAESAIVQDIMARLRLSKALDIVDDLALQYIVQQTRNFSRGS